MAEIRNKYFPQSIPCKFGVNCKREECSYSHYIESSRATPKQPNKVQKKQTPPPPDEKKTIPCIFWNSGICKWGDQCKYLHEPKPPALSDILSYQKSDHLKPNIEDGMLYTKPNYPGLPELPRNGKCRICDSGLIIYFIPFYKPIGGVTYFKKIRLYRYNIKKRQYTLVFNYSKKDFHFTSAAASNGYLVCSRLPYDGEVLNLIEEAKRLKKSEEYLQEKLKIQDANHKRQMEQARKKYRDLSDKMNRKPVSVLRVEKRSYEMYESNYNWLNNLIEKKKEKIRLADPVDLFVFDPVLRAHVHVLEYHKPADHVHLQGKKLFLWDMNSGLVHKFKINLLNQNVANFDFDNPIQPKKLCDIW